MLRVKRNETVFLELLEQYKKSLLAIKKINDRKTDELFNELTQTLFEKKESFLNFQNIIFANDRDMSINYNLDKIELKIEFEDYEKEKLIKLVTKYFEL